MTAHSRCLRIGLLCLVATAAPAGSPALSQSYPASPVKIVTQIGAGNGPDVALRIVAEQLGKMWGQQVVVVNQPGAGGLFAARTVIAAPPDGYTLLLAVASTFVGLPELQPNLPFTMNDFVPIGLRRRSADGDRSISRASREVSGGGDRAVEQAARVASQSRRRPAAISRIWPSNCFAAGRRRSDAGSLSKRCRKP